MYPNTRMTRLRRNKALRNLSRETELSINDFILPVFIIPGCNKQEPIPSMPGVFRYSVDAAVKKIEQTAVTAVILFGVIN